MNAKEQKDREADLVRRREARAAAFKQRSDAIAAAKLAMERLEVNGDEIEAEIDREMEAERQRDRAQRRQRILDRLRAAAARRHHELINSELPARDLVLEAEQDRIAKANARV